MKNQAQQPTLAAEALIKVVRGNQITLPAEIRKALRVAEGDYLRAQVVDNRLVIEPVSILSREQLAEQLLQGLNSSAPEDLVSPVEAERRLDEILSRVTPRDNRPARSEDELVSEVADTIRHAQGA